MPCTSVEHICRTMYQVSTRLPCYVQSSNAFAASVLHIWPIWPCHLVLYIYKPSLPHDWRSICKLSSPTLPFSIIVHVCRAIQTHYSTYTLPHTHTHVGLSLIQALSINQAPHTTGVPCKSLLHICRAIQHVCSASKMHHTHTHTHTHTWPCSIVAISPILF